jgi:hypothetical protein
MRPSRRESGQRKALRILDALHLACLASEEDALDGAEVQSAGHLDLELDFIVAADVAPGRIEAGQAGGALDEKPAVPQEVGEADLGRVLPGDGAVSEPRGLLCEGALGELVGLTHEARR